jgi:hypothetical protein
VGFNDFIKNDFIPEGDGQVASGSASLPDPVALEVEERRGSKESRMSVMFLNQWVTTSVTPDSAGISVETVPVVVNIRTLHGRFIAHRFSTARGGRWVW